MRRLAKSIKNTYINQMGFHTDKKILVIDSDDWGSIRMPSREVYNTLLADGDCVDKDAFLRYDCLEREEDLYALYDMLSELTDINGRHPCITANFAVANPDFSKINLEQNQYAYESIEETYRRYYPECNILKIIKDGIEKKLFFPQLHAREHMNVIRWMNDLENENPETQKALKYHMIGIGASFSKLNQFGYMDALNYDSKTEVSFLENYIIDAVGMFKNIFGYSSETFVASCYTWTDVIEEVLAKEGVRCMKTQCWQKRFLGKGTSIYFPKIHYTGEIGKHQMRFLIRNCEFEPSLNGHSEAHFNDCIRTVEEAFANGKPAIINSHRVNYIGALDEENAQKSRNELQRLLHILMDKYPTIEFMTANELLHILELERRL